MRTDDDDDDSQVIIKIREWIPHKGLVLKAIPLKLFLDLEPSSPEDDTSATHGPPKRLSRKLPQTQRREMLKRRSIIQMFYALPAAFCSAGFCLLCACLAVLAFFYRSFGFTELKMKQATTAKVKSKMAVYAYVIILCSFLYHSLQNNKE